MHEERVKELFKKYYDRTATEAETETLMALLAEDGQDAAVMQEMLEAWNGLKETEVPFTRTTGDIVLTRILGGREAPVRRMFPYRRAAAAAVLLLLGGAAAWIWQRPSKPPVVAAANVQPGYDKATLTLADGSVVTLDSNGRRTITQGSTTIRQQAGQLLYEGEGALAELNTLSTPRGGQFRVTLPDGTQVWLNAASSITFPTAFNGADRSVKITGEAYFEVAQMANKPFKVNINDKNMVQVLGTSFNINSYTDEPYINTTLLSGGVRVSAASENVVLRPLQQAQYKDKLTVVPVTTTDQVMAWKDGAFYFTNADLPTVLRQVSRWYDVEIVYEGKIPQRSFGGEMGRDLQLTQVLGILGKMDVKFKLEGNKLIVMQ
ncbi:FecR family protein [uncultured Chitinophaga sp.]|uniref:FecR family protein n=1 Tax=uncultured Chitinophaga sp. TaxID=339340 RepID=UPI0025EB5A4E|nr:FecR family protein [uncultured Chitinophaga sp.]